MTTTLKLRAVVCGLATSALLVSGCADMSERQKGTAQGAGIGAVAGAVISSVTGGRAGTGAVVGGAVGAVAGNLWSKRMEDRRVAMEQATRGTNVEVSRTADNQLKLNIPNDISFDTGSYAIKPQLRAVLDPFANSLREDPAARVFIVGHTDNTGSDAINIPLSVDLMGAQNSHVGAGRRYFHRRRPGVEHGLFHKNYRSLFSESRKKMLRTLKNKIPT